MEVASSLLLPILAQWALTLKRLQTHLLPRIISKVKNHLKSGHSQQSPNKDHIDEGRTVSSIGVLQYLLPHVIIFVADTDTVRTHMEHTVSSDLREWDRFQCKFFSRVSDFILNYIYVFYHTADVFLSLCHSNIVNPKVFYDREGDIGALLNMFFENTWENDSWPELEWFTNKL